MKNFNLKFEFKDQKCVLIEKGDFGPVDESKPKVKTNGVFQDSLAHWPVDPDMTGAWTILSLCNIPVSDHLKIKGFQQ